MSIDLHYILWSAKPQIHVGIKSSAGVTIDATLKYSHQLVQSHNGTQLQNLSRSTVITVAINIGTWAWWVSHWHTRRRTFIMFIPHKVEENAHFFFILTLSQRSNKIVPFLTFGVAISFGRIFVFKHFDPGYFLSPKKLTNFGMFSWYMTDSDFCYSHRMFIVWIVAFNHTKQNFVDGWFPFNFVYIISVDKWFKSELCCRAGKRMMPGCSIWVNLFRDLKKLGTINFFGKRNHVGEEGAGCHRGKLSQPTFPGIYWGDPTNDVIILWAHSLGCCATQKGFYCSSEIQETDGVCFL